VIAYDTSKLFSERDYRIIANDGIEYHNIPFSRMNPVTIDSMYPYDVVGTKSGVARKMDNRRNSVLWGRSNRLIQLDFEYLNVNGENETFGTSRIDIDTNCDVITFSIVISTISDCYVDRCPYVESFQWTLALIPTSTLQRDNVKGNDIKIEMKQIIMKDTKIFTRQEVRVEFAYPPYLSDQLYSLIMCDDINRCRNGYIILASHMVISDSDASQPESTDFPCLSPPPLNSYPTLPPSIIYDTDNSKAGNESSGFKFLTSQFGIVSILLIGFFISFLAVASMRYMRCCSFLSTSRQALSQEGNGPATPEEIERRKKDIQSKLIQKKICNMNDLESNSNDNDSLSRNKSELEKEVTVSTSYSFESFFSNLKSMANVLPGRSDYSPLSCPICLEEYVEGEDICCSPNHKCVHVFHLSCMTEWLLRNNNCPICRCDYLEVSPSQTDD